MVFPCNLYFSAQFVLIKRWILFLLCQFANLSNFYVCDQLGLFRICAAMMHKKYPWDGHTYRKLQEPSKRGPNKNTPQIVAEI